MSSLQHVLAPEPGDTAHTSANPPSSPEALPAPVLGNGQLRPSDGDGAAGPKSATDRPTLDGSASPSATTFTKRNATGPTSSVYSGNKMKHLKKDDGIPLWRKDIQYDFLKLIFDDPTKCFTKYSDGSSGHTYADIYIDAMAKSSKCSKVLKEKLLHERENAVGMAMVCLLVNIGRMNTTLNFFPEMRAQLRTYHSIPALQLRQDPNAYKLLQDAPRLKSILKGATEDEPQPSTVEEMMKSTRRPRTNPLNLIFIMSQYALKISEQNFSTPCDFFDLIMRTSLSSASRARAFLWLNWWYLESDFTAEDSQRNPFGPGQYADGEEETGAVPQKVPPLESLTEEQVAAENVDTEEELNFGELKRKERIAILASESSTAPNSVKRSAKGKGAGPGTHGSDDDGSELAHETNWAGRTNLLKVETASDYTRSPSPTAAGSFPAVNSKSGDIRINNLLNGDDAAPERSPPRSAPAAKKGPGRGNWRRKPKADPSASDGAHPVPLLPSTGPISFVSDGPNHLGSQPATPKGRARGASQSGISPGANGGSIDGSGGRGGDHVPTPSYQAQKRHRGITQHQSAVISHRKQHIDYTLDNRIRRIHNRAVMRREAEGPLLRAWKRARLMPPDYDSEEEAIKIRRGANKDRSEKAADEHRTRENRIDVLFDLPDDPSRGPCVLLAGFVRVPGEPSDVGEELKTLARTFRRCSRRLERWQTSNLPGQPMLRRKNASPRPDLAATPSKNRRRVLKRTDRTLDPDADPDEFDADPTSPARGPEKPKPTASARKTADKRGAKDSSSGHGLSKASKTKLARPDAEPDLGLDVDDGAGAELDDEDREILGEIDADDSEEDEDEDEDEEMGD